MKLLELLYEQENKYIEEIDRLEKNPDDVVFIEADEKTGWICLKASENSYDWNIVRLVGDFNKAKNYICDIPFKKDYILLVDKNTDLQIISNCIYNGSLLYFENTSLTNSIDSNNEYDSFVDNSLLRKNIKTKASPYNSRIDDLYLIMKNRICGYCKLIKSSWHYAEVAIEINPEYRNQGFGSYLLDGMLQQFNEHNLKMSYVVENDNIPSVKLANKFLKKSFELDKYLYRG